MSGMSVWVLFKSGQVVEVFPNEDIAELIVEDVCLGPAFAKGESIPLEGGYASYVTLLAVD